jgi:hypothetical protein
MAKCHYYLPSCCSSFGFVSNSNSSKTNKMKNNYINGLGFLVASFFLGSYAHSQAMELASAKLSNPVGQVIIGSVKTNEHAASKTPIRINTKVERSFLKFFKHAGNASWSENAEFFIAEFNAENRHVLAYFTKSGLLYCTSYYGSEKHLPYEYKKMLHRVYADYKVVSTTEVKCNAAVGWVITIQNYNSVKKVKIVDSTLEEIEHLSK